VDDMLGHNNKIPPFRGLPLSKTMKNPKFQRRTSSYSSLFSCIFALMASSTASYHKPLLLMKAHKNLNMNMCGQVHLHTETSDIWLLFL